MKKYDKTTLRLFKSQIIRFLTLVLMLFISVSFMTGIGESQSKIQSSLTQYYQTQNIPDFILKSHSQTGFSQEQIQLLQNSYGEDNVMPIFSFDTKVNDDIYRVYKYDIENSKINILEVVEGEYPKTSNEIMVERHKDKLKSFKVGDQVTIMGQTFTVSGIVQNPLLINKYAEPSNFVDESLDYVVYISNLTMLPMPNTDVYISLEDRTLFNHFSSDYKSYIDNQIQVLQSDDVTVLSLYQNYGLYALNEYAIKVGNIGAIFSVFFMLVTILVVFSTMTRLFDEERGQIACLKTLGYSSFRIISKYILFVVLATILGGLGAFGVGTWLTNILYSTFNIQFVMPQSIQGVTFIRYVIIISVYIVTTFLVTLFTGLNVTKNRPATLLLPKSPPIGRRTLLEKIPFIWNRLSFKYKSSFRNVFLFRSRFFMTLISIIGATILVFSGLGLLDCAVALGEVSSIIYISIFLIVFAALLSALVIYNLSNINISERKREIATLMVLGYTNSEVTGYIYREIYIISIIAAILGVPCGVGFLYFLFNYISFGAVSSINWWSYILAPLATIFFTFISTLLLRHKIVKTDMNASLKSVE